MIDGLVALALMIVACSVEDATQCKTFEVQTDFQNPMQCMMMAPGMIGAWGRLHPKWKPARFTCRPPTKRFDI